MFCVFRLVDCSCFVVPRWLSVFCFVFPRLLFLYDSFHIIISSSVGKLEVGRGACLTLRRPVVGGWGRAEERSTRWSSHPVHLQYPANQDQQHHHRDHQPGLWLASSSSGAMNSENHPFARDDDDFSRKYKAGSINHLFLSKVSLMLICHVHLLSFIFV